MRISGVGPGAPAGHQRPGGKGPLPGPRLRPGAPTGHRVLLPGDTERHIGGAQVSSWSSAEA